MLCCCSSKLWRCANASTLGGFALGLGVGTALTYGLSPTDYLASFNLMDHFLSKSSDVNRLELLMQWRSYLAPVLLLLLLMTITGVGRLPQLVRQSPGAVIVAAGLGRLWWVLRLRDGVVMVSPVITRLHWWHRCMRCRCLFWDGLICDRHGLAVIAFVSPILVLSGIITLRLKPVTRRFERIMERSGDENQAVYVDHSGLWIMPQLKTL